MVTLRDLRRTFVRTHLRRYRLFTTGLQTSTPNGSYSGIATGADARRILFSSDLVRVDVGGTASLTRNTLYQHWWAYVLTDTPEMRGVTSHGLTSSAVASTVTNLVSDELVGYVTLDRALNAVVDPGTEVELHAHPILDRDVTGIHTCLNEALEAMETIKRITLYGVSDQWEYDLSGYSDILTRQAQLRQVLGPISSPSDIPYLLPGGIDLRYDGDVPYLVVGSTVNTGQTFLVDISLRRSQWIKSNGSWRQSTVGLVADDDECSGDIKEICLVAWYFFCEAMVGSEPNIQPDPWEKKRQEALSAAAPLMKWGQVSETEPVLWSNQMDSPAFLARRPRGRYGRGGGRWP